MLNRHLVDAAWVWPRVLQDCELLARYYTSESYALDMTKGDAQVVITRDLALSNFHFDAWVYPYTVEGQQMILASQDGKWGIGLEGTSVMIYIYKSKCACKRCATCEKPCMEWFQMSSHRALVRPLRWSFITVGYSQATQGGAAEMRLVIDGVLMDSYTWNATTSPGTATDSGDMPLMVGDDPIRDGKRFQGQIAHIALGRYNHWSVTTPIGGNSALASYYQVLPYSSQLNVQCPGGGPNIQQARNIGHIVVFGDDLPTDLATPGVAKLLSNVSYDSQTDWSSTTLFGLPRTGNSGFINSDHLAHFTLTLRNKCKQKRPVGGADIAATIQLANSNVQLPLDIIDTLDANYHASFNATDVVKKFGVCSSDYSVFITYQAPDAVRYNRTEALEIRPAATSPRTTSIYNPTNPNTPTDEFINGNGCFGVVNRWEIQARDAQGCKKLPIAAGNSPETFEVTLTGPATIQANVTYRANSMGLYDVYWMAPAAGTYQLHAYMVPPSGDKVPVSGDGMCLEVCAGKSLEFIGDANNEGWIQVTAVREGVSSGLTDLELAEPEGFTIETWFSISGAARSGTNGPSINADRPYLLFKNKREPLRRSADQIKGYSLGFDPAYESLIATVYCGLGVYRNVTADLSTFEADEWVHASAVYNTTSYTLYLNGAVAARSVYDQALPAHPNMYNHPLVIGMGFRGYMDELKLWKKPRTHDEVVSTMYCPPYLELKDVAGYWSFNDKTEENLANMMGVGASCMPMQPDSVNTDYKPTCLVATIPFRESSFFFQPTSRDNTPLKVSAYGRGMGSPSARLSRITGPGLSSAAAFDTETPVLTVHAMDKCGFAYNRGFPRNARAADPTMEDPAAPRITDLFTTNVQPISTVYLSPDPPLESLPDGYPIILEGAMEPAAPPAAYEPGPCYADPAKPIATNSPGNTFNLTIYATRTGNSYLDIRLLGEPMLDHREMLGGPAFDFNATEYAPFILPITSGPPSTIEVREGALRPVTAGVPSGLDVRLLDVAGNGVEAEQALTCTITPLGTVGLSYPGHVTFMGDGNYVVVITAPSAGNYKLSMELNLVGPDGTVIGVIATSFDFVARAAAPRPLITASMPPAAAHRFEHTTVIHDDKLYVWGGAGTSSGAHRNDMWSLPLYSTEPTMGALAWKKTVTVLPAVPVEGEVTIKVIVDTLELFVAGRVQPTCADVAFVLPPRGGDEETILPYHLDKEPGCRSTETVFWVKLPEGVLKDADETQVHMYYGNPHPHQVDYERSADALLFYEGFEDGEIGSLNGTRLNASTPCGTDDADAGGFVVTSELAYSGSKSLKASFGARGALEYLTEDRMDSFTLRAAFYDNDALDSSHFMSPNYDRCRLTPGKKPLIPNPDAEELRAVSTAVGTYTLAHVTQLCVSTPWTSVNTTRSAKWHQLEVTSTPQDGLKMYIDGVLVKEAGSVTLDRVFLSAGFGVDDDTYEGLPTSMAMWDEIVLAALTPSVAVAAESIQDDDSVAWIPGRKWVLVETGDSPAPPPRQGHCSFLHDGSLYVYGGERAGYAFSDLWRFSFGDEEWELLSDGDLPARYDAACFFMPDTNMFVVNGGKSSRVILSDTWAYELTTGEWVAMEDIGTGGRFGHTAVYAEGSAYLFGGFTEAGFSRSLYKCFAANNPVGGCAAVDVASGRQVSPRFAHTLFSDGDFLYVHGGTNLESRMGFSTTWRYSLSRSVWDQVATDGDGIPALQHTGLLAAPLHVSGDARLGGFIVHGGTNMDDDNVYFLSL